MSEVTKKSNLGIHQLMIDTIDACNLSCVGCPRGLRLMKSNFNNKMDIDTFRKVIERAVSYGFRDIGFLNWTEPLLQEDFFEYTEIIKEHKLTITISSNLSIPNINNFMGIMKNCDVLYISVSGFTNEMQNIYHRGSNIDTIKKHIQTIGKGIRDGILKGKYYVKYLAFGYNKPELEDFKRFTEAEGLLFLPTPGAFNPVLDKEKSTDVRRNSTLPGRPTIENEIYSTNYKYAFECKRASERMTINYKGDAYLCCSVEYYPYHRIGNFLLDDLHEIQMLRLTHEFCNYCTMYNLRRPLTTKSINNIRIGLEKSTERLSSERQRVDSVVTGKSVYFWGCGRKYQSYKSAFSSCKPKYIFLDKEFNTNGIMQCDGISVIDPDVVLPHGERLPIIVFADNPEPVFQKILEKYPGYSQDDLFSAKTIAPFFSQELS